MIIVDEVIQIYENAVRQSPNNEELANHWFMALVRNHDYKGQQQVIRYTCFLFGLVIILTIYL